MTRFACCGPVSYEAQSTGGDFPSPAYDRARRGHDVTGLLLSWRGGNAAALDRLVPLVYDELRPGGAPPSPRRISRNTLQATALVHEVYLRLVEAERPIGANRAHSSA